MYDKIEEIIKIEWEMFQNVDNIGGRASCQEDPETFYIMRKSQYDNWSPAMVDCYLEFARRCKTDGRNLPAEKYARMMAYTNLHYYNKHLAHKLPQVPLAHYRIINKIIEKLIAWEEEMAVRYPKLSGTGRPIRSSEDYKGFTSMETYARGELETYPKELLEMYATYVETLAGEGKSLAEMNQLTMVNLYGYETIEDAEASL